MPQAVFGPTVLLLSTTGVFPPWMSAWWETSVLRTQSIATPHGVVELAMRARPRAIVLDFRGDDAWAVVLRSACAALKRDSYTAIVPVIALIDGVRGNAGGAQSLAAPSAATPSIVAEVFAAGADEVLCADTEEVEAVARLNALLRRSDRDTDVHPSTRLPGARAIEEELVRRVATGEKFAACYADLDHFKEFNDRYGYYHGDGVIRLLAQILHDVVKGVCAETGFVGHIGGDDFLFVVPVSMMAVVCDEIVRTFEELISLQYSEQDQRVGYFFGKDRRGQLHRVPLMTLSIGVVTNQARRFTRGVEVSELATEMKTYAKTLPGSLWAVDRRRDEPAAAHLSAVRSEFMRDRFGLRSSAGAGG